MVKLFSITLLVLFAFNVKANTKNILDKLDRAELDQILKKETILKTKRVKRAPWPIVYIYGVINATPIEAISVYAAYDEQKVYTPDLIISNPIKQINPTNTHVLYERDMPWPLSNINYTTGNIIKKSNDGGYELSWYQVKNENAKETRGKIKFYPYKDITIIEYENFLYPTSFFASLLKETMLTDIKATLDSIINYIENVKENTQKMTLFKKRINDAFQGKFVY